MEKLSVDEMFAFFEENNLQDVAGLFKENDIDGAALEQMLKEEPQCSLKELIPKMGPILRTLRAIELKYGKPATEQHTHKSARAEATDSGRVAFKGQLKLQMEDGKWSMEKLDEMELEELQSANDPKRKLEEASKIYGLKNNTRVLTDYEKAVNTASFCLVESDPSLIRSRDKLYEMARSKVREDGFCFKKGASRSTFSKVDGDDLPRKRPKTSSDDRRSRLEQIEKEQNETEKAIKIKEQRRSKAQTIKDFALCDTISTEIRALLNEKHVLENEKKVLTRKESKASWFSKKKSQRKKENKSIKPATSSSLGTLESLWSSEQKNVPCAATTTTVMEISTDEALNDPEITCTSDKPGPESNVNEESTSSMERQDF